MNGAHTHTHTHTHTQNAQKRLQTCKVCKVFVCPYTICSDCCIVLCWSWWVVVVVVVESCCCIPYRLVLMLVLTFAPSVLTFAPCACGVILPSTSASTPLAHMVVVTGCNLHWWRFSFSHWRKHSLHRWWCHPLQLALVVFFLPPTGAHTPLALKQLALCGGLWWWQLYVDVKVVGIAMGWWWFNGSSQI